MHLAHQVTNHIFQLALALHHCRHRLQVIRIFNPLQQYNSMRLRNIVCIQTLGRLRFNPNVGWNNPE
jgi:hypothetical protein